MPTRTPSRHERTTTRGQSIAEFALIVPLMFFLVVAIGDYGRLYASAVAIEAAAREAADYGAYLGSDAWDLTDTGIEDPNVWTTNEIEMRRRACSAAANLPDYAGDPIGTPNMNCTNPTFSWDFEQVHRRVGGVGGNCKGTPALASDPCILHVKLHYTFHMVLNVWFLPHTFTFERESRYAVSDLTGT